MIYVDTNSAESAIAASLARLSPDTRVERRRLDVGDILVTHNEMEVCIERKTWADLAASICDGRLKEQKSRMLASDHIRYVYAVEGDLQPWTGTHRNMVNKCMWGALVKTMLRDDMFVFHTLGTDDTATLTLYILAQLKEGGLTAGGGRDVVSGTSKRKRGNLTTPIGILTGMLVTIPGMSAEKASSVTQRWPSVAALMTATTEEIASTMSGNRKLGPKMAQVIQSVFDPAPKEAESFFHGTDAKDEE